MQSVTSVMHSSIPAGKVINRCSGEVYRLQQLNGLAQSSNIYSRIDIVPESDVARHEMLTQYTFGSLPTSRTEA